VRAGEAQVFYCGLATQRYAGGGQARAYPGLGFEPQCLGPPCAVRVCIFRTCHFFTRGGVFGATFAFSATWRKREHCAAFFPILALHQHRLQRLARQVVGAAGEAIQWVGGRVATGAD